MPLDLPFPLCFPSNFEAPLFRTFFHFPWDFEIAGFDCTNNYYWNLKFCNDFFIILFLDCLTFPFVNQITYLIL